MKKKGNHVIINILGDRMKKFIKDLIPYVVILVVVVLIRTFIVTPVRVNGTSMVPTLDGGEIMILNKLGHIDRYDIVVLDIEEEQEELIKRIIGLPGETVEIKNNEVYINDELLGEEYGYGVTYNIDKITLKDDEYFVLGDNRIVSKDSRVFGAVKKENIKGTTKFVVYPFKKFGTVK